VQFLFRAGAAYPADRPCGRDPVHLDSSPPYGRHLAARFGIDPDDPSTFLFFDHGRPREASDAVIAMLGRLPRPWRWLRALRILPRFMRDALYRLVARNRYRLLGKRDSCMIPAPHVRARFIDEIPTDAR
jgi:predicted DCC family thiol-disulfide oxidoreductase YuxK